MDWSKYKVKEGVKLDVDRTWPAKEEKLKVGDFVEGVYKQRIENVGPNKSNVYVVETENGKIGVWGSTVLDTKFESIEIGSKIAIEYLGKAQGETGRFYHDFKVGIWQDE